MRLLHPIKGQIYRTLRADNWLRLVLLRNVIFWSLRNGKFFFWLVSEVKVIYKLLFTNKCLFGVLFPFYKLFNRNNGYCLCNNGCLFYFTRMIVRTSNLFCINSVFNFKMDCYTQWWFRVWKDTPGYRVVVGNFGIVPSSRSLRKTN